MFFDVDWVFVYRFGFALVLLHIFIFKFELTEKETLEHAVSRLLAKTNLKHEFFGEKYIIIYKNDRKGKKNGQNKNGTKKGALKKNRKKKNPKEV